MKIGWSYFNTNNIGIHTHTHTHLNVNKETVKFTTLTSQFTIWLIIKDNNGSVQSLKSSQIMFVDMIS